MSGYFSQLARHTGLNYEARSATAANNVATPSVDSAPSEGSATLPLHVEAITFTPSAPLAATNISEVTNEGQRHSVAEESIAFNETRSDSANADASTPRTPLEGAISQREADITTFVASPGQSIASSREGLTDSEVTWPNAHLRTGKEDSLSSEPRSSMRQTEVPLESFEIVEVNQDQFAGSTRHPANTQPVRLPLQAANTKESGEAREQRAPERPFEEPTGNAYRVNDYLREVMAWVSATPEVDESELGQNRQQDVEPRRKVLALEQAEETSLAASATREPEIHNLDLSIGSISIVIEEPKTTAPASFAAPQSAPRSSDRTTREPTNLSRYYLRSW